MLQYGANESSLPSGANAVSTERIKPTLRIRDLGLAVAAIAFGAVAGSNPASALPSFARQTGQPCGACHVDFPGLTPFGRQFKLGGYTLGGGKYQTTPFAGLGGGDSATKALDSYVKKIKGKDGKTADSAPAGDQGYHGWVPPIAMMGILQYTHRGADITDGSLDPFQKNDNMKLNQASIFWGGAITDNIGLFAQYTYEPLIGGSDSHNPYDGKEWHWDNVDLRYANTAKLGNVDVTYGLTATNNPTMSDPWNTTPAWGFPYTDAGDIAPGPAASTMIDGAFAQHVGSAGGYGWFDNLVYVQLSGFWSLNKQTQGFLGIDPQDGVPGVINGVAPYWRVAVQPHWGNNWWEFGTFGMTASVNPYDLSQMNPAGEYTFATYSQTNRFTDVGFDSQYQYQGDNYWVTLRGSYIHENQSFDNPAITGTADNTSNTLNNVKLYGSFAYGNDNRVVLSGQWFDTWGSTDATEYGTANGSPNTNGFTAEIAYIPYILSHPTFWPWANARLGLQYTWYNKFDGTSAGASDNNTLNAYLWVAM